MYGVVCCGVEWKQVGMRFFQGRNGPCSWSGVREGFSKKAVLKMVIFAVVNNIRHWSLPG